MTETPTADTRTVREYRHTIRNLVSRLPVQQVGSILAGVVGLSQEQQVERLDQAITAMRETGDKLGEARTVAVEARDFAANRDFAAHQAAKGKPVGTGSDADDEDVPDSNSDTF